MIAEIVAIGSELTSGQKLDTNSQWLSLQLADLGIPVHFHTTVADDLDANIDVLKSAMQRADLVLLTGGLGPTLDDLTRQALAGMAGVDLVLDEASLAFIENFFAGRGRDMPERNRIQAMFPAGSEPLPNPVGTAPGIWMEVPGGVSNGTCRVAALPGVPSEMHRMFTEQVRPRLPGGARIIRRARINCFGVGESRAEDLLGDLTARGRDPEIGITAHEATITMRIIAHGSTEQECREKIADADRAIRERLGHYVFGVEDEELEHVLIRALRQRGETLATAESGTGGRIAHCLTGVDDFEDAYLGGLVVPTDHAREAMLGPLPDDVREEVSEPMALWMARACRERFGTDYALAVTQYPFMEDGQSMKDAPSAYLALATAADTIVRPISLAGNPAILRSRVAKSAMDILRLHLRQLDTTS
ncbi:CinA family nicotinamide mononucleotide deamidase-related protein [Maioricimonas sp. JC845]|uniref:CinA family nicotinamide mononucleotide deamidase-related protein n=1 Tax=Maioricimonas sp. JC845 TaxID=3232138 RepID=UPI00345830B3